MNIRLYFLKPIYYLYIDNSKSFNLNLIKIRDKFSIIYRNNNPENIIDLKLLKKTCDRKGIKLFVANNVNLLNKLGADGLYLSSYNKKNIHLNKNKYELIGSAHNIREIQEKKRQGCKTVILSRLFKTDYKYKKGHLGIIKINLLSYMTRIKLVSLGGIRTENITALNMLKSKHIALLTEIKKKPAKIINRLF
jgi:thiamine-phosphate pyrophosphorylase